MLKLNAKQLKNAKRLPKLEDLRIADMRKNPKLIREFLRLSLEEYAKDKDLEMLKQSLGIAIRALGTSKVSKQIKVDRSGLYKSFTKKGRPAFETVCGIFNMAGVELTVKNMRNATYR